MGQPGRPPAEPFGDLGPCRTVAKVDSIGSEVHRWTQCSAGVVEGKQLLDLVGGLRENRKTDTNIAELTYQSSWSR